MLQRIAWPLLLLALAWLVITNEQAKTIVAGIAIFLIGMHYMENGFKLFSGGMLEKVLEKFTDTRVKAISTGFFATAVVQSSSLVSVIVISFLSAELIGLTQAVGVIFGANIGTTSTAWLVSSFGLKIKISHYALPMLIFGVAIQFTKNKTYKGLGSVLIGLGFIFLGIAYMKEGFETLKDSLDLAAYALQGYLGVVVYILFGAVATVVIQSSSATMAIIITALAGGQIDYINALSLAIGANLGTTVTAALGAMASNRNGKRLAIAHLIFNLVTGLFALLFIYQLKDLVDWLAPMLHIANNDDAMRLALFHTIFNFIGVLLVTPFSGYMVQGLQKLFRQSAQDRGKIKYLSDEVSQIPAAAIEALRKETIHLYDKSLEAVTHAMNLHRGDIFSQAKVASVIGQSHKPINIDVDKLYQSNIKHLYSEIIRYASIAQSHMDEEESEAVYELKITARYIIEMVKDIKELQRNLNGYLHSNHLDTVQQYDKLRAHLVKVLRKVQQVREFQGEEEQRLTLIELQKEKARKHELKMNQAIEQLIREQRIAPAAASSLMNDIGFTHSITRKLLKSSVILWVKDQDIKELGDEYGYQ